MCPYNLVSGQHSLLHRMKPKTRKPSIANTTAQFAKYMGALKSFESRRKCPRLLFPKFVKGFCSDRY